MLYEEYNDSPEEENAEIIVPTKKFRMVIKEHGTKDGPSIKTISSVVETILETRYGNCYLDHHGAVTEWLPEIDFLGDGKFVLGKATIEGEVVLLRKFIEQI